MPATLNDFFAKMDNQAVKPVVKTPPKKKRPVLELPQDLSNNFNTFIGFQSVLKEVESQTKNYKQDIEEGCFELYVQYLWENKCTPPSNPKIEVLNGEYKNSAVFQVQGRFKVDVHIGELSDQSPEDIVVQALVSMGVNEEKATSLVSNEIDFTPDRGMKSFTKIFQEGTDAERLSLQKLMAMTMSDGDSNGKVVVEALTAEDRYNLMYNTARAVVVDPKKFLDRVCIYASNVYELQAILKVIKPTHVYPSHIKFMDGAGLTEKNQSLQSVAVDMLELCEE